MKKIVLICKKILLFVALIIEMCYNVLYTYKEFIMIATKELMCIDCKKPFSLNGSEQAYFESKALSMPKRCPECRKNKKREKLFNQIINIWSIEAKKEDIEYFYYVDETNLLKYGNRSFVIGRKGSGKTAMAQYINESSKFGNSVILSFKNFPFNILYELENIKEYTAPNQYISMWKYMIYTQVCILMCDREDIDYSVRSKLKKLYNNSPEEELKKMIKKWTSSSFGAEVLGCGLNYSKEKFSADISWFDIIDVLEKIIIDYCNNEPYYIIFDELDEDYKDFQSQEEENRYKSILTSLFKAIYDVKNKFSRHKINIHPIAFLRSDIYSQITDSDKNKWYESTINLEWDTEKIKKMLAHRLCVAMEMPDRDFDTAWGFLFSNKLINMGSRKRKELPIYEYIERSTEMRPRDFIKYIQECVTLAVARKEVLISPQTVKDADEEFSEYLKRETIDELFAVLPEINDILGLLSTIRKQRFAYAELEKEYDNLVKQGVVEKNDLKKILLLLFDAGVIGNVPSIKTKAVFKFSSASPRFNFTETMIIHRGLFKALQIY